MRGVRSGLGCFLAHWPKLVMLGLIITMVTLVSIYGFAIFGRILHWFKKRNGWGGWGVYVGFYTAVVTLFIPGVVFIMGAGFVFGFWRGLLAVWIGGAIGQALAFLLARYLLRDGVESFVRKKWKKWTYIDAAIENEGWKLVLVMRLSPVIPYNMLNIAMALTSMHFLPFAFVSAIGIVFECSIFTYLGTMADSITSIVAGESGAPKAYRWVLLGLSLAGCIIGAVIVSIIVRKAIKRAETMVAADGNGADSRIGMSDGEEDALLAGPSALEREGFVSSMSGEGAVLRTPFFEIKSAARALTPATGALIASQLRSPPLRGYAKAKSSPKGSTAELGAVFQDRSLSGDVQRGDLEMGQQKLPASASRRRSTRNELDEDT
jgi:uncharacterized membrane protein YdjX (TVP38/TMEM64 family)